MEITQEIRILISGLKKKKKVTEQVLEPPEKKGLLVSLQLADTPSRSSSLRVLGKARWPCNAFLVQPGSWDPTAAPAQREGRAGISSPKLPGPLIASVMRSWVSLVARDPGLEDRLAQPLFAKDGFQSPRRCT